MNFKNKIFITFLIIFAFILFFNIDNVFAVDYPICINHNGEDVYFTEFDYYDTSLYSFYYYDNSYYVIVLKNCKEFYNNGFNVSITDPYNHVFYLFKYDNDTLTLRPVRDNSQSVTSVFVRKYDINSSTWSKPYNTYYDMVDVMSALNYSTSENFVYSNFNCYNAERTELVFQQPVTEVTGVTIPALETADQIPQAIVTTLKILIPVGLIVLSIGLVIYLIKRVRYSIM